MSNLIRLSVSKTKTFLDCKKKYNFVYIQKLPKKDWDHHIVGKFCHKVLEDFHNEYIKGSTVPYNITMNTAFKAALTEYKEKMNPEMKKECWDLINKYLKIVSEDKKNKISANVLACEKSFELPVGDKVILNGMIDRIQLDDDNVIHVCDYKTTKNKKYIKNDFFQLLTYAYVMINENPSLQKIRASYILMRHDFEYITAEFSVPEILKIKDQYIKYAEEILAEKEYPANPGPLCQFCDHLSICKEGQSKSFNKITFGEVNW